MLRNVPLLRYHYVLEPSAGQGAIAEFLTRVAKQSQDHVVCIEKDLHRWVGLLDRGFPAIHADFLSWSPNSLEYDRIYMHPPWGEASLHVIKAWDLLTRNGMLAAVLPGRLIDKEDDEGEAFLEWLRDHEAKVTNLNERVWGAPCQSLLMTVSKM